MMKYLFWIRIILELPSPGSPTLCVPKCWQNVCTTADTTHYFAYIWGQKRSALLRPNFANSNKTVLELPSRASFTLRDFLSQKQLYTHKCLFVHHTSLCLLIHLQKNPQTSYSSSFIFHISSFITLATFKLFSLLTFTLLTGEQEDHDEIHHSLHLYHKHPYHHQDTMSPPLQPISVNVGMAEFSIGTLGSPSGFSPVSFHPCSDSENTDGETEQRGQTGCGRSSRDGDTTAGHKSSTPPPCRPRRSWQQPKQKYLNFGWNYLDCFVDGHRVTEAREADTRVPRSRHVVRVVAGGNLDIKFCRYYFQSIIYL